MEIRKLKTILAALRNARDTIEMLATENFPYTDFEDEEIGKMFYELNKMAITMSNKIDNLADMEEN